MDKINIYIDSKNRQPYETSSNFIVNVPENVLRLQKGEFFTLNVNGFYCFNTWFNCIDNFNNMFQIIIKNINNEIVEVINYRLNDGNPNVNDVKNNLNALLMNKVSVSYDRLRNKFTHKRVLPVTNTNYELYLNIINSEDFLGFFKNQRNIPILLPYLVNVYSSYVVNTIGDEALVLKMSGDCILSGNTMDNFGTVNYEPSNIIFVKAIDVPVNGLLQYNNIDSGDSFQYRLANIEQVRWFNLSIYNQDDELIPNFSDYILLLQFVRHKTENKLESLLNSLVDYVKQIYLMIAQVLFPPMT